MIAFLYIITSSYIQSVYIFTNTYTGIVIFVSVYTKMCIFIYTHKYIIYEGMHLEIPA